MDNDEPSDPKELLALLETSCKVTYQSAHSKYTGWVSYDEYYFYLTLWSSSQNRKTCFRKQKNWEINLD